MVNSIVWFTTDLRLHDNETLLKAIENSDSIIPVYCLNTELFKTTYKGFKRMGKFRAKFLLESLNDLSQNLLNKNSGLLIVCGNPDTELPKIARQYGVTRVYAKREVAPEERALQQRVEQALWNVNCSLETYSTSTLYHPADIPFATKDIPDIFTRFRLKLEKEGTIRPPLPTPDTINSPSIKFGDLLTLSNLGIDNFETDARTAFPFLGGESRGLARLNFYLNESKLIANYKETRNQLIGANYSSKFSAWLSLGCLSARQVYYELKKFERFYTANQSTYWLYFELMWRDFFRYVLKKHQKKFFTRNGLSALKYECIPINNEKLNRWINGTTGVDFVDANMRELKLTGYMSNRGRQNVASYFCHDLKMDWRIGAAYFEQQLIDYDVCSNYGNWAYLAGVGNDPRPNRYFDIEKQSQTYDPRGEYRALWLN